MKNHLPPKPSPLSAWTTPEAASDARCAAMAAINSRRAGLTQTST